MTTLRVAGALLAGLSAIVLAIAYRGILRTRHRLDAGRAPAPHYGRALRSRLLVWAWELAFIAGVALLGLSYRPAPLPRAAPAAAAELALEVANAEIRDHDGTPRVYAKLTQRSSAELARFTRAHLGQADEILLDGAVIAAPVLHAPIVGGIVEIGGVAAADGPAVVRKLKAHQSRLAIREQRASEP